MLQIKTIKNPFVTDESKDGFYFRCNNSKTISMEELAAEMTEYNSSFTVADNFGILKVLETVIVKNLAKGNCVELPFGILKVSANGTCATLEESFSLGSGNHTLTYIFNPNLRTKQEINAKIEYKQLNPDSTMEGKIYRLNSKLADASESSILQFAPGSTLRIHGRSLSFDFADDKQGVFLENESGIVKVTSYERHGTNIIEAKIPEGTQAGFYDVYVVTKPNNVTYFNVITPLQMQVVSSSSGQSD